MSRTWPLLMICSFCLGLFGCTPGRPLEEAAVPMTPLAVETSPAEPASGDFDEPVNVRKLAVIELFVQRLRDGAPVADLLKPKIDFVYVVESECAAVTSGQVDQMPASDVDSGFVLEVTYAWENPDCAVPAQPKFLQDFNLATVVARWGGIGAAAEDHDFEAFILKDAGRSDYLLVRIERYGKAYAVSQIEYRLKIF